MTIIFGGVEVVCIMLICLMMYIIQFCCLRITLLLFWLSGELIRESCTLALNTLTEIRSKYWIPQGRAFVRRFIGHCVLCRRYSASSYSVPSPPPLPEFRVRKCSPFTTVGVDYAGPLVIKHYTYTSSKGHRMHSLLAVGRHRYA